MTQKLLDVDGMWIEAEASQIVDSTGKFAFSPESLAQSFTYYGDGKLESITVGPTPEGHSFKQTLSYVDGRVSAITAWVKQ